MRHKIARQIHVFCVRNNCMNLTISILSTLFIFVVFFAIYRPFHTAIPFSEFQYPTLINISSFVEAYKRNKSQNLPIGRAEYRFLSNPNSMCSYEKRRRNKIFLLFLIKSKAEYLGKREAIRQTWANDKTLASNSIKRVFMIGKSTDKKVNENLKNEIKFYDDVLLINYLDNYDNNTIKTLSGLRWLYKFCENVDFVMLVDDDYFVATNSLLTFLKKMDKYSDLFMGYEYPSTGPFRLRLSKWYMSYAEYAFDKYPPYISGGAVIMTKKTATTLYIASKIIKVFKIDDVYLAIVAHQLGIKPKHNKDIYVEKVPDTNSDFKTVLAAHGYEKNEMYRAWECHDQNVCYFSDSTGMFIILIIIVIIFIFIIVMRSLCGISMFRIRGKFI